MRKYCQCEYVVCQGVPTLEIKYLWSANEKALDPMNPKFDNETLFSLKFADTKLIGTRIRKSGVQEVVRIDMCPIRYLSFGDNVHLFDFTCIPDDRNIEWDRWHGAEYQRFCGICI